MIVLYKYLLIFIVRVLKYKIYEKVKGDCFLVNWVRDEFISIAKKKN